MTKGITISPHSNDTNEWLRQSGGGGRQFPAIGPYLHVWQTTRKPPWGLGENCKNP